MTTLSDMCSLIRSKNAGPFLLTFDLMFSSAEFYQRAKRTRAVTKQHLVELYGAGEAEVTLVYHDAALAIKASIPRPLVQCAKGDGDCYGGQQYVPLLSIEVAE